MLNVSETQCHGWEGTTVLTLTITRDSDNPATSQQVAFAKNTLRRTMPVPIITNPMKLRQKLSESASHGPTPSYFGLAAHFANDTVQH